MKHSSSQVFNVLGLDEAMVCQMLVRYMSLHVQTLLSSEKLQANIGIHCIRLSRSTLNLCDPVHVNQAIGQLESTPGADAWASVTCTHHSPIQNLNIHMYGKKYKQKLNERRAESENLASICHSILRESFGIRGGASDLSCLLKTNYGTIHICLTLKRGHV